MVRDLRRHKTKLPGITREIRLTKKNSGDKSSKGRESMAVLARSLIAGFAIKDKVQPLNAIRFMSDTKRNTEMQRAAFQLGQPYWFQPHLPGNLCTGLGQ